MRIHIKNWKLALLALIGFCFFIGLGSWQIWRAQQKKILLATYQARGEVTLSAADLSAKSTQDIRFFQIQLIGHFDTQHTFLLDNKIFHGAVGYEVYTPFVADGLSQPILIDRGFVPLGNNRATTPQINTPTTKTTVTGLINLPPTYVALGEMTESPLKWPLRLQFIDIAKINKLLDTNFLPFIVNLSSHHPGAFAIEWQIVIMSPERHLGYAVQWFALALTLLILFVALNRS